MYVKTFDKITRSSADEANYLSVYLDLQISLCLRNGNDLGRSTAFQGSKSVANTLLKLTVYSVYVHVTNSLCDISRNSVAYIASLLVVLNGIHCSTA